MSVKVRKFQPEVNERGCLKYTWKKKKSLAGEWDLKKKVWKINLKYSYFFATQHELVVLNFVACYVPFKAKLTFISLPI